MDRRGALSLGRLGSRVTFLGTAAARPTGLHIHHEQRRAMLGVVFLRVDHHARESLHPIQACVVEDPPDVPRTETV